MYKVSSLLQCIALSVIVVVAIAYLADNNRTHNVHISSTNTLSKPIDTHQITPKSISDDISHRLNNTLTSSMDDIDVDLAWQTFPRAATTTHSVVRAALRVYAARATAPNSHPNSHCVALEYNGFPDDFSRVFHRSHVPYILYEAMRAGVRCVRAFAAMHARAHSACDDAEHAAMRLSDLAPFFIAYETHAHNLSSGFQMNSVASYKQKFYLLQRASELRQDYERRTNSTFAFVLHVRADTHITGPFPWQRFYCTKTRSFSVHLRANHLFIEQPWVWGIRSTLLGGAAAAMAKAARLSSQMHAYAEEAESEWTTKYHLQSFFINGEHLLAHHFRREKLHVLVAAERSLFFTFRADFDEQKSSLPMSDKTQNKFCNEFETKRTKQLRMLYELPPANSSFLDSEESLHIYWMKIPSALIDACNVNVELDYGRDAVPLPDINGDVV